MFPAANDAEQPCLSSLQMDASERKSVLSISSFFLWASSLLWFPMASDIAFGSQNPGLSRDRARSRTSGSLKVISMPSYVHNAKVASPLRPIENQPKPAIAMSTLFTSQLAPDTLISLSSHVPISKARSAPIGGYKSISRVQSVKSTLNQRSPFMLFLEIFKREKKLINEDWGQLNIVLTVSFNWWLSIWTTTKNYIYNNDYQSIGRMPRMLPFIWPVHDSKVPLSLKTNQTLT